MNTDIRSKATTDFEKDLYKLMYVGFCILDLSKYLMYDFHYNFMLKKYGYKRVKLLFTDTDSLCYGVQTEDFYADMLVHKDKFDMSEYPTNHMCCDPTNKKVIGKFTDETKGDTIAEFVGLKAKMYSMNTVSNTEKKVAKGIKRSVIKKGLFFEGYKNVLFGKDGKNHTREVVKTININSLRLKLIRLPCVL
jgi:hypothetical protein